MKRTVSMLLIAGAMITSSFALAKEKEVSVKPKKAQKESVISSSKKEKRDCECNWDGCFDFYDSCGGTWQVCHVNVSTSYIIDFLWAWDGGC